MRSLRTWVARLLEGIRNGDEADIGATLQAGVTSAVRAVKLGARLSYLRK